MYVNTGGVKLAKYARWGNPHILFQTQPNLKIIDKAD